MRRDIYESCVPGSTRLTCVQGRHPGEEEPDGSKRGLVAQDVVPATAAGVGWGAQAAAEAGGPEVNMQMSQESQLATSGPKTQNRPSQLLTGSPSPGEHWEPAENSPRDLVEEWCVTQGPLDDLSKHTCDLLHSLQCKAGPPYKIPYKTVRGRQEHKGTDPRAKYSDHTHT